MLKVGMISKWHVHAEDYRKLVANTGKAEVIGVWDDDEKRGSEWAEQIGAKYYSCLDEMLKDVEAVVVCAPTTQHTPIIKKCLAAGVHIFTEKVLAPTVAECEELTELAEKAGVKFVVSMPGRVTPVGRFIKEMMERGDFGKVSLIRQRMAHDGYSAGWLPEYWYDEKDAAGGAMMDLGCTPMYVAPWLCGKAKRVSAMMSSPFGLPVDEAATATIEFENGIVFTAETSFISYSAPGLYEVYGSDATLINMGHDTQLWCKALEPIIGKAPVTPKLPEQLPMPVVTFIDCCADNTEVPEIFSPRQAIELTRLLEAAYTSDRENRIVEL